MKFLLTYAQASKAPPTPEKMAAIGKLSQEMAASGVLLMTGGLERPTRGTQVRLAQGKFTATDGPFAETKEALGGFYLVEAADLDEAIRFAAMIPGARRGSIEIRPVFTGSAGGSAS